MKMKLFFSVVPSLVTFIVWVYHGARLSFWATSTRTIEEIPIIEGMPELGTQSKVTWQEGFVCGIETPVIGLCLSIGTILFFCFKKDV